MALDYRAKITRLEEKIVILETALAEMELNALNLKSDLESQFRMEKGDFEKSSASQALELEHAKKHIEIMRGEINKTHQQEINELKMNHEEEVRVMQNDFDEQLFQMKAASERKVNDLNNSFLEKMKSMELKFSEEKTSLQEELSREKYEIQSKMDKDLAMYKMSIRQEYKSDLENQLSEMRRGSDEYERWRNDLRTSHEEETNNLKMSFSRDKQDMQVRWL